MPTDSIAPPAELAPLVERFHEQIDAYRSGQYNETAVRREFIDPLFSLLGWDVDNRQGHAEQYKEVIHEDAIRIGGLAKAPDYCFRVGGTRKFFVEAKKPSVNVKGDIAAAFQVRRYAWSAKLPLSILTDFEEFSVYDCRKRPERTDAPATGRILYMTYTEYQQRWSEIARTFSKEAILKGAFDRFAESARGKRGTAEVDDAFLAEIESWRDALARNLAVRNPGLTQRELNFAVQRTIDRIIFLRICEDRGIEPYGQIQGLINGANTYRRLCDVFDRADDRYNSGLFHFHAEAGRPEAPDELSKRLAIDDKVLKDIFKRLYYPDSPYEFSVLPADILGQVYEQFLGKVIRLTAGHQARVEEKPEVKKAGGVYYTPTYIVDYIVAHTVGKLLEGKNPKQAARLRILDPACGSGSFLIGAYQYLLDWHLQCYLGDGPEKHAKGRTPALVQSAAGWRLTTAERKRILLNNIHGVDIDSQAVEVTKLSLLLKVLEGETEESLNKQISMFRERALPDLGSNIKCGNSLIGPDFYSGQQLSLMDEEEMYRVNVFDWHSDTDGFGEIMKAGGFDAVIGNPPYIRIQALKEWAPLEVEFYKKRYASASKGNYDIYVVFVEKGLSLLCPAGLLGYILPHKFFNAQYGEPLRSIISAGRHLSSLVHFGDQQVFANATTYTCLLFLAASEQRSVDVSRVSSVEAWRASGASVPFATPASSLGSDAWHFSGGDSADLIRRLRTNAVNLSAASSRIFQGIKTSADKVYIVEEIARDAESVTVYSRERDAHYRLEPDLLHPLIKGGDSKRYALARTKRLILFPYARGEGKAAGLISDRTMIADYPLTWRYLQDNRDYLENRENGKMRGPKWYGYVYPKALDVMPLPKIFTPDIAARASFSLDDSGEVFFTGGVAGGYGILCIASYSPAYLLALLNSRVLEWVIRRTATQMRGGYYSYESRFIRDLPIRTIDFSDPKDPARHDKIVCLVERMLDLNKRLAAANLDQEKTVLKRQIEATDREIDALVYELYELTPEEIAIVEGCE